MHPFTSGIKIQGSMLQIPTNFGMQTVNVLHNINQQ